MGSRFALLIAAAVVFAPGWYGEEPPGPSRGSDLAARVLAPTFDKGSVRAAVFDAKDQLETRQANRRPISVSVPIAVGNFGLGATAFLMIWIIISYSASIAPSHLLRSSFSRAPPRFQPA